jgi:hypothetical protein
MNQGLLLADDIGIFRVHIEQARAVRRLVAVAASLPHDASTQLARRQPLVVRPVIMRVSTPHVVSVEASEVPKNALGYCFDTTSSSSRTFRPAGHEIDKDQRRPSAEAETILVDAAVLGLQIAVQEAGLSLAAHSLRNLYGRMRVVNVNLDASLRLQFDARNSAGCRKPRDWP